MGLLVESKAAERDHSGDHPERRDVRNDQADALGIDFGPGALNEEADHRHGHDARSLLREIPGREIAALLPLARLRLVPVDHVGLDRVGERPQSCLRDTDPQHRKQCHPPTVAESEEADRNERDGTERVPRRITSTLPETLAQRDPDRYGQNERDDEHQHPHRTRTRLAELLGREGNRDEQRPESDLREEDTEREPPGMGIRDHVAQRANRVVGRACARREPLTQIEARVEDQRHGHGTHDPRDPASRRRDRIGVLDHVQCEDRREDPDRLGADAKGGDPRTFVVFVGQLCTQRDVGDSDGRLRREEEK